MDAYCWLLVSDHHKDLLCGDAQAVIIAPKPAFLVTSAVGGGTGRALRAFLPAGLTLIAAKSAETLRMQCVLCLLELFDHSLRDESSDDMYWIRILDAQGSSFARPAPSLKVLLWIHHFLGRSYWWFFLLRPLPLVSTVHKKPKAQQFWWQVFQVDYMLRSQAKAPKWSARPSRRTCVSCRTRRRGLGLVAETRKRPRQIVTELLDVHPIQFHSILSTGWCSHTRFYFM